MASFTFMFMQLLTVAPTSSLASSLASSADAHLPLLLPQGLEAAKGFFSETHLDAAMWDAFAEAMLALTVFGLASAVLGAYRKKTTATPSKTKASFHTKAPWKAARCRADTLSVRVENQGVSANLPSSPGRPAPGLTSSSHAASKECGRVFEADAVASAVRAGKASMLPQILDAALRRSLAKEALQGTPASEEYIATQLLLTAIRACAASRCFNEAILAYDHMAGLIGEGSASLWSVLLYTVVEAGAQDRCKASPGACFSGGGFSIRCKYVFENLCKHSSPSGHDFVNMVRCYAGQRDPAGLRGMLGNLRRLGHSIDAYNLNRALAACSVSDSVLDLVNELTGAGICPGGLDAVGYNTIMKYNARAGRISQCFQLRTEMTANGIEASEVTFGILLDACVAAQEIDRAREVFDDLCSSGLQLNVVHCTSFIKVMVSARRLDEAAGVLQEMAHSPGVKPDLITYSTLVKAYADSGEVHSAVKMLELMLTEGVKPDEIIFNSVLSACSTFPMKSVLVMRTFETLIGHGMKPTTTTLSILLKCLAHTEAWSMSLQILQDAPKRFGLQAESRLYAQLVQACIQARQAKTVLDVFEAMFKSARQQRHGPDPVAISRCLRSCVLGGELDVAKQLWEVIRREGVTVDTAVEKLLKAALAKRSQKLR